MKRCPTCSTLYPDDQRFCTVDGTLLEATGPGPAGGPPSSAGLPPAAWAALGAAVVIAALALGVLIGRGGGEGPVASFLGGAVEGDAPAGSPAIGADGGPVVYADAPGDGFLALRSEPSVTRGARIGEVLHGVGAEVLSDDGPRDTIDGVSGRWLRVRTTGGVGWVFGGFTTTEAAGRGARTTDVGRWALVNGPADGALNLRTGPTTASAVVSVMRRGTDVYVPFCRRERVVATSGVPGRWCRVRVDLGAAPRIGWAFDAYLDGVGG